MILGSNHSKLARQAAADERARLRAMDEQVRENAQETLAALELLVDAFEQIPAPTGCMDLILFRARAAIVKSRGPR